MDTTSTASTRQGCDVMSWWIARQESSECREKPLDELAAGGWPSNYWQLIVEVHPSVSAVGSTPQVMCGAKGAGPMTNSADRT